MLALLAQVTRNDVVESEHYGHLVVASRDGVVLASVGNVSTHCYFRSSAKPLQALAVVESGALEAFGLSDRHLALMCGSHAGLDEHARTAAEVLAAAGLTAGALGCGAEAGYADPAQGRLRHNCSGKHSGMLATCVHLGLDTATYLRPDHPHQRRIRQIIAAFTGVREQDIAVGVDGCGVPTFAVPLPAMAVAFARLASPDARSPGLADADSRVRQAMAAYPDMVSGPGQFNTELLRQWGPAIVAKGGAEGLFCLGLADRGLGVALKVADGSARGIAPALLQALHELGVLPAAVREALAAFVTPEVRNSHGLTVGDIRPVPLGLSP
jgi:L-asparaginase II